MIETVQYINQVLWALLLSLQDTKTIKKTLSTDFWNRTKQCFVATVAHDLLYL